MIGAVDFVAIGGWIFTAVVAGVGAAVGAYVRTRAERRAIAASLDDVERRIADMTEAARARWSRRSEVCATLYGHLMKTQLEFAGFLGPSTTPTDAEVEELHTHFRAFSDYFSQNALFLPKEIKQQVHAIANELRKVRAGATMLTPESGEVTQPDYRKRTHEDLLRLTNDGELGVMISKVEDELREALALD